MYKSLPEFSITHYIVCSFAAIMMTCDMDF